MKKKIIWEKLLELDSKPKFVTIDRIRTPEPHKISTVSAHYFQLDNELFLLLQFIREH
jgi:hypothetical protein